jgi:hypothetical protein
MQPYHSLSMQVTMVEDTIDVETPDVPSSVAGEHARSATSTLVHWVTCPFAGGITPKTPAAAGAAAAAAGGGDGGGGGGGGGGSGGGGDEETAVSTWSRT